MKAVIGICVLLAVLACSRGPDCAARIRVVHTELEENRLSSRFAIDYRPVSGKLTWVHFDYEVSFGDTSGKTGSLRGNVRRLVRGSREHVGVLIWPTSAGEPGEVRVSNVECFSADDATMPGDHW